MANTSDGFSDDLFSPQTDPDSARVSDSFEALNATRAIGLLGLLDGASPLDPEVAETLTEIGFPSLPQQQRFAGRPDPLRTLEYVPIENFEAQGELRKATWGEFAESGTPESALGFLVEVLGSPYEQESVAAAGALRRYLEPLLGDKGAVQWPLIWHYWSARVEFAGPFPDDIEGSDKDIRDDFVPWDPARWQAYYRETLDIKVRGGRAFGLLALAELRLALGARSADPIIRSLALAALAPSAPFQRIDGIDDIDENSSASGDKISTMVHGTRGWRGDWWRPAGGFHRWVKQDLRSGLYSGGARFSWSGAYSRPQRELAALDFCEWASDRAPDGLRTVFGHSYGGEISIRALQLGISIDELVLLSCPVNKVLERGLAASPRTIDVRLRFDPVLALARTRQRIRRPGVTSVVFRSWTLNHSATHEVAHWHREEISARASL